MKAIHKRQTKRACWRASLCLFAYLLSFGWLVPMFMAAVAASDDEHHVLLSTGPGGTRITLAHDPVRPVMAVGHHHCLLATVLTAFAAPVSGEGDHVLSFPEGLEFRGLRDRETWGKELGTAPELIRVLWWGFVGTEHRVNGIDPSRGIGGARAGGTWSTVMRC